MFLFSEEPFCSPHPRGARLTSFVYSPRFIRSKNQVFLPEERFLGEPGRISVKQKTLLKTKFLI